MKIEIFIDLYCDEVIALSKIQNEFEEVDIEYVSGITGLEIVGTLIIPSTALLLQIISFIKDLKKNKHKSIEVKKIEVNFNSKIIIIPPNSTEKEIENIIKSLE